MEIAHDGGQRSGDDGLVECGQEHAQHEGADDDEDLTAGQLFSRYLEHFVGGVCHGCDRFSRLSVELRRFRELGKPSSGWCPLRGDGAGCVS